MATESPIRISEGTDGWRTLKKPTRYGPSSAKMAIEGLGLFLKDQQCKSIEKDVIPSRSESAPPSMEGSIAALHSGSSYQSIYGINNESETRFHPSSLYHDIEPNSDRRLTLENEPSCAEEESEDDRSSVSVSVEKAGLLGFRSRSLDSTQEACHSSSPSYDQNYKSAQHNSSVSILVEPRVHERDIDAVKVNPQDNLSTSSAGNVDSAHFHVAKSVDVISASNSDSKKFHLKEQAAPHESNTPRVQVQQDSYPQVIYPGLSHAYGNSNQFNYNTLTVSTTGIRPTLHSSGFTPPLYASAAAHMTPFYPNMPPGGFFTLQYGMAGYNLNSPVLPSYLAGYPHQNAVPLAFDPQNLHKIYSRVGVPSQPPFHMQYFEQPSRDSYSRYFDHQMPRDGVVVNQVNSYDSKNVGVSNEYKPQHLDGPGYNNMNNKRGDIYSHYYFGSPTNVGPLRQFPVVSPVVQSRPTEDINFSGGRYNTSFSHSPSGNANRTNGPSQTWKNVNSLSFLEELRAGKGQRLELSDIAGYIVELSIDQHGSRFIQQKLETCSVDEKASVFKEVVPHASKLITDVFGNYVVQKLFEHGSPEQRMYLANQLEGQILPLSFQMYGCRVIQKALEFIDLEQKARLVRELDGHVIRCVRDQNGNHVIQKCIESIPTDNILFIISSFRGQVAALSMHPYGCRVIQRFLEHCNDDINTHFIVDEILNSVCSLAQDQYGNYVMQHVLEKGKSHERVKIIEKLAGSVVRLSQHKFASNVVEKCLEYSDSTSRGLLIKEIIGDDDKNDNLLIMMKDQYANYVIQRVLEKCSNDHREILLGQIRNHLTSLKKYTYGKHIVARFEQLYGDEIQEFGS